MQLYERLNELVGHEVSINSTIGAEEQPMNEGILEEVGEDYIVIKPFDSPDWPLASIGEYSRMGGHWFVKTKEAIRLILQKYREMTPYQLSKLIKLSRTRCNEYLKQMEDDGLTISRTISRKKFYSLRQ